MQINMGEMIVNLPSPYGDINFYFRPSGWSIKEHSPLYYQLILVTRGVLTIYAANIKYGLSKGDLCIIPPNVQSFSDVVN